MLFREALILNNSYVSIMHKCRYVSRLESKFWWRGEWNNHSCMRAGIVALNGNYAVEEWLVIQCNYACPQTQMVSWFTSSSTHMLHFDFNFWHFFFRFSWATLILMNLNHLTEQFMLFTKVTTELETLYATLILEIWMRIVI